MHLSLYASGMVSYQKQLGNLEKTWGMSGFSGFRCGEVEYGVRGDEFMVRLMSDAARQSWRRFYELCDSVTRIDVQTTIDMKQDCQELVWKYYQRANRKSAKLKRGPKNRVILGSDGGATLYCGERTSTRFGRVYAKGPQTKLEVFETTLRFEIQYNGRLAKLVARKLYDSRPDFSQSIGRCCEFFDSRIGNIPLRTALVINDSCSRKRSDVARKLHWLSEAVRPSVQMLIDLGLADEVVKALGLPFGPGTL